MNQPIEPGRLVMVSIEGTALAADTAAFLARQRIRAVCLFRQNLGSEAQIQRLCTDLRDVMGEGALIAIDQEGGSVARATLPAAGTRRDGIGRRSRTPLKPRSPPRPRGRRGGARAETPGHQLELRAGAGREQQPAPTR